MLLFHNISVSKRLMYYNGGGMASMGLRAISCQVTRKIERVTTLRIPPKPLLAIPHVVARYIFNHSIVAIFCQVTEGFLQGNKIKPCKGAFVNPFIIQVKWRLTVTVQKMSKGEKHSLNPKSRNCEF